jgi:hypothetical protein
MLKIKLFILVSILSLGLKAQELSGDVSYRSIDIQNVDIVAEDFVAEIDFGPELKVVSAKSNKRHKSVRLAKDEAYFNAIVDNEIDVLIDPIYSAKKYGKILFIFGGYVEVKVVGFAGYYKNVLPESRANAILFDDFLNEFIDFSASNNTANLEESKTIIKDKSCRNCKEKVKLMVVNTKQQSKIDLYEKSKSKE